MHEPGPPPGPPPWPPPPRRAPPRARRAVGLRLAAALAVLVVALGAVGLVGTLIRVPYVIVAPGEATPVEPGVTVRGTRTYPTGDDILFVTVSIFGASTRPSLWRYVAARLDPDTEVVPEERYLGGQSRRQVRRDARRDMALSQQEAAAAAARLLGYPVEVRGAGARVLDVVPDSPAARRLRVGDVIVAVDGRSVRLNSELGPIIRSAPVGTPFRLGVRRGDARLEVVVRSAEAPSGDLRGRPYLGVLTETVDPGFELPFEVEIDPGDVSGPSAGLAFALSLVDTLTPGDLTGGRRVAATGTIGADGRVGEVGGVPQKAVAARRAGARLFLVPAAEVGVARPKAGERMRVVGVRTLEEALQALERAGGDPVELRRAA